MIFYVQSWDQMDTPSIIEKRPNKQFNYTNDYSNIQNADDVSKAVEIFLAKLTGIDYELREAYNYTMILPESFYGMGSFLKWIRVG